VTILGLIARARPADAASLRSWLGQFPGVDVALEPGDGRLILVIEDSARCPAAAAMAEIALHPQVVALSLVYEYSGAGSPAAQGGPDGFAAWRSSLKDLLPAQSFEPIQRASPAGSLEAGQKAARHS